MKKLFLLLLFLLIPSLAFAGEPIQLARMNSYVAGAVAPAASCADTSCTGFLVCQNLEGTGYDNSETWVEDVGTPNEDYTTTVLRGSQSLFITEGNTVYFDLTASSEVYIHFRIRFTTDPAGDVEVMKLWNSAFSTIFTFSRADTEIAVIHHGSDTTTTTATLAANTAYHLWIHYAKGTGANGVHDIRISTTATMPVSADASSSSGVSTTDADYLAFKSAAGSGLSYIVDQILVKTTSIGTVCE